MDYTLPRADNVNIRFLRREVPCTTNPLGIKGAGEAGAIGAPPAIVNAVVNALTPHGVKHIDMPLTPDTVWRCPADCKQETEPDRCKAARPPASLHYFCAFLK